MATPKQDDLPGVITREEQLKAFRRARRHSGGVKVAKLLFPVLCVVTMSLYLILQKAPTNAPTEQTAGPSIEGIGLSSEGLKMINPSYTGHHDKMGSYKIGADYALQDIKAPHKLDLHSILGTITHPDKRWTKIAAEQGLYDTKKEQMNLSGKIHITSNRGMEAQLTDANVDIKKQVLSTVNPVMLRLEKNTINADKMTMWNAEKRLLFEGRVKMRLYSQQSGAAAALAGGGK